MEEFTIERDNGAALAFTGELIAKVSSSDNNASGSSYSGQTGRWQVLAGAGVIQDGRRKVYL